MKTISVIIPCHNAASFIDRAVASAYHQEYVAWELLLVENNSTDNTLEVLHQIRQRDPERVRVLVEEKKGAPAARNKGLAEATGHYIQFLDADDELLKDKWKRQVEMMEVASSDFIIGKSRYRDSLKGYEYHRKIDDSDVWTGLIASELGSTCANLWGRDILLEVGGWKEDFTSSQEYYLMFSLLKSGAKAIFDLEVSCLVHVMEQSVSRSRDSQRMQQVLENRIQLRLAIKRYLAREQELTPQRSLAVDKYIYKNLMQHKLELPRYIKKRQQETALKVPVKFRLQMNYRYFKQVIRKLLNL